jgi:hypothetical protein
MPDTTSAMVDSQLNVGIIATMFESIDPVNIAW